MAVNKKTIQRRIKSVKNTRKITKAMELVAAAKMKRATESVLGSRPYVTYLRELVKEVAETTNITAHPLLHRRQGREKILLVMLMSDRGLCGGYNVQMTRRVRAFLKQHAEGVDVDVVTVGKRAASAARLMDLNIVAHYADISGDPHADNARPIVKLAIEGFVDETYDDVFLAYTDFKSAMTYIPRVMQLLPLVKMYEDFGDAPEHVFQDEEQHDEKLNDIAEFTFEPGKGEILNQVLPRIVESMVYQGMLESAASEHSARMLAMKNASEAAKDMIESLTLTYNQARQAAITQEIAEISGGKAALE